MPLAHSTIRIALVTVVIVILCAVPSIAHAQWAHGYIEHDWRVIIGGNSYGLVQQVTDTTGVGGYRTTTIYLGPYRTTTHFRAAYFAVALLLPMAAGGVLSVVRLLASNKRS